MKTCAIELGGKNGNRRCPDNVDADDANDADDGDGAYGGCAGAGAGLVAGAGDGAGASDGNHDGEADGNGDDADGYGGGDSPTQQVTQRQVYDSIFHVSLALLCYPLLGNIPIVVHYPAFALQLLTLYAGGHLP